MPKLKCTKHGEHSNVLQLSVSIAPNEPLPTLPQLCFYCFCEAMIRLGVCAMFPTEEAKTEDWIPEELGEGKL